jgi:glycosyltransferase involved in cell wall biosynthesis
MQPYESAQGAMRLAQQLRKPLVADLGDPWALDEMMVFVTSAHRRLELARMRAYFRAASAVVLSTREAAARALQQFPELHAKPVEVIPNGFDAADFAGPPPQRDDDAFRIVHTGYLHTEFGLLQRRAGRARRALGGTVPGLDILTRSHVYLLEAVDRVLAGDPSLAAKLEVHLAGVLTPADIEVASRSSAVRTYGYVPHSETVGLVRSADLLFLPMQNLPPGVRATIVPGKTYEYLASERPILAAVPDGDARDILAEAGSALLCRPDDVTAMAEAIARQLAARRAGRPSLPPRREVVARYEYGHLAARLADVFASVSQRPAQVACAASR